MAGWLADESDGVVAGHYYKIVMFGNARLALLTGDWPVV